MSRMVCRSQSPNALSVRAHRITVRDSQTPYVHENMQDNDDLVLTRLRPDGVRQPIAEARVLININYMRLGLAAPQNLY